MKNKSYIKIIAIIIISVLVVSAIVLPIVLSTKKVYLQDLNYEESVVAFNNPDQGFYRTMYVTVEPDDVQYMSYVIKDEFQLYHLRMDISAFSSAVNGSSDIELTSNCLEKIELLIKEFIDKEKNIILRFAYDKSFDGKANLEPSENMMLRHIEQICGIVNKYALCVTAIEAGMVGPWGEMHTSDLANSSTINKIIQAYLDNTTSIPILVRSPQMIYDYLSISINELDNYSIDKSSKAGRLGLFNDGFLASDTDLGTYSDRIKEVEWIAKNLYNLPYGGEVTGVNSNMHDINNCLNEMDKLNLSYLNYEWNDAIVQNKWQQQIYNKECGNVDKFWGKNAYEFIKSRLGYRLLLTKSEMELIKNKELVINLDIDNIGFGNLNKVKDLIIYLVKDNVVYKTVICGEYLGGNIQSKVDISDLSGEYCVYLALSNRYNNKNIYSIRLANDLWNEELRANKIGVINIT